MKCKKWKVIAVLINSFSWPAPLLVLNMSTCPTLGNIENTWTSDMACQFAGLVNMSISCAKLQTMSFLLYPLPAQSALNKPDIKYVTIRHKSKLWIALLQNVCQTICSFQTLHCTKSEVVH